MILKLLIFLAFFGSSFAQDAPVISCNFTMSIGRYTCLFNVMNSEGFDEFEGVEGAHMEGMTNADVLAVTFASGNSSVIPRVFCNIFPNLQFMTFTSMGVQSITNNPIEACPNLDYLRVWNNLISEIAEGTFANNGMLTYIDLDRNQLTQLPVNVFNGLTNLTTLELRNNLFEDRLQAGIFRPLVSLRVLYLNHCGIPSINRQWFETLTNLQQLWIYNNNITAIGPDQFVGLPNIIYIDLDSNRIETVAAGAFNGRITLTVLYLYNNLITELVEGTFDGTSLIYVDLDRNLIENIQDGAFRGLTDIVTLYLDGNRIKNLTSRTFEGLPSLRNLYLNFNEIEDLPEGVFASIENLTNLGLWNNSIKVFHRHYFGANLTSLGMIDLDDNVVNGIERSILEEAVNLQTLWFWNNLCFSGSMFNFQANRGSFMVMLERCFNNHQFIVDTITEGSGNYHFYPFPTPGIQLRVNVPQDAHISLNPLNFEAIPRVEIHIGASDNSRSIIRINGNQNVVDVSTPGILERNSWTGFRIVFSNFMVLVFREGHTFPFMAYNMQEFYPINFYGIRTPGNPAPWSIQPIQ